MHVTIATLYGIFIWLIALGFTAYMKGPLVLVILAAPFIVSGSAIFLMLVDLAMASRAGRRHRYHV